MSTESKLKNLVKTKIEIKQVNISGHKINYSVSGHGPDLLLVHGANFGWGVWHENISELSKHFRVFAIDLPGSGRSSRIDYKTMDPEKDLLEIVKKFIYLLKLEKPSVVGFSLGGWITMRLSIDESESIGKIVVVNSVGIADYMSLGDKVIGFYPLAKFIAYKFINPKKSDKVENFLRGTFSDKKLKIRKEFLDYFGETMKTSHNLLFISRLTAKHKELNLETKLKEIKNPTLVVWGEDDKIIPLKKNIQNFKQIPNSSVRIIKGAGHIPPLETPVEFNKIVIEFLQS